MEVPPERMFPRHVRLLWSIVMLHRNWLSSFLRSSLRRHLMTCDVVVSLNSWDISSGVTSFSCTCVRSSAKECVNFKPFGDEMLALMLSASAWINPTWLSKSPRSYTFCLPACAAEVCGSVRDHTCDNVS